MATIITKTETQMFEDTNGNMQKTTKETTQKIQRSTEPDFIKIYTNMWCEFNQIPEKWRSLFLQLAIRMTYCRLSATTNDGGQIVYTGKPQGDDICRSLGWEVSSKTNSQLMKGLRELCHCKAIRKINRGVYQINPQYAAKGEWKYNPRSDRGGVEDLVAIFNFKDKTVKTNILWADDGKDSELNEMYRQGLEVSMSDNTILKTEIIKG